MGPIRGECVSLAWSLVTNESNRRVFPAMKSKLGAFGSSLYTCISWYYTAVTVVLKFILC